jgi:hypothetical protein
MTAKPWLPSLASVRHLRLGSGHAGSGANRSLDRPSASSIAWCRGGAPSPPLSSSAAEPAPQGMAPHSHQGLPRRDSCAFPWRDRSSQASSNPRRPEFSEIGSICPRLRACLRPAHEPIVRAVGPEGAMPGSERGVVGVAIGNRRETVVQVSNGLFTPDAREVITCV